MKKRRAPRCTPRGTGSSSPTRRSTGGCRVSAASNRRFRITCSWRRSWPAPATTTELRTGRNWRSACQAQGCDALELNPVLPAQWIARHGIERRQGQRARLHRHQGREGDRKIPVWAKLTPSTTDIVLEARGAFLEAPTPSFLEHFTSLPLIDADTLDSSPRRRPRVHGGLGRPAILPLSLRRCRSSRRRFRTGASRESAGSPPSRTR